MYEEIGDVCTTMEEACTQTLPIDVRADVSSASGQ